jgi:hypothetical protein
MGFLIKEKIIVIPPVESGDVAAGQKDIPDWVKNTIHWWSTDQISDEELVSALQFLVKQGIIQV